MMSSSGVSDGGAAAQIALPDETATQALGAWLAAVAFPGLAVLLTGPLGAGKSVLTRAMVRAWLGDTTAEVPSPTFTLVQPYEGPGGPIWHFDLYRLGEPDELWELGIEEALAEAVSVIEWPDRLGPWIPEDRLEIELQVCQGQSEARLARIVGSGRGRDLVARLREEDDG